MAFYNVVLKDADGYDVSPRYEENGLKDAKWRAKYLLSEDYMRSGEFSSLPGERVEVLNDAGECVWDAERSNA